MVAGFSRSFSLTGSPRLKTRPPAPRKSYHARSVSLPCRSHPLVAQLEDEIRSVKSWQESQPEPEPECASASWICDGLSRLELLHASLNDLINLPQSQDSIRRGSGSEWTDRILADSLRIADAYGCFRSEIVAMGEHQSEAQIAVRRNDAVKLESCVREMKKTEKKLVKLASLLREVQKPSPTTTRSTNGIEEAELAGFVTEVTNVTVSASMAVFLRTAAVFSAASAAVAASSMSVKNSWARKYLKNVGEDGDDSRRNATERLERLEECICAVESRSERLLRCLINTRVLLLNTLTH